MSFDWADYLTLADGLNQNPASFGVNEASFRCAASRAYYSAFCSARNVAVAKHNLVLTTSSGDQKAVTDHFYYGRSANERLIGQHLRRLRKRRNQADYDDIIMNPAPSALAHEAIALAERILIALKSVK
jgi:uncharacterized protein (UPF0332 family)